MILYCKPLLAAGGVPPLPPDAGWRYAGDVYIDSGTYVAEQSGWRRFHVIGYGGAGGKGGQRFNNGSSGPGVIGYGGYGGGSGATGSFAIHAVYMWQGETATITVTTTAVTLVVGKDTVIAPAGGAGTSGPTSTGTNGTPTKGGTPGAAATGGNIINRPGTSGKPGSRGGSIKQDWNSNDEYVVSSASGGKGADAPINQYTDSPYAYTTDYAMGGKGATTKGNPGGNAIYTLTPLPILGQSGAGGSGAGNVGRPSAGYGGNAGRGGVVIELG